MKEPEVMPPRPASEDLRHIQNAYRALQRGDVKKAQEMLDETVDLDALDVPSLDDLDLDEVVTDEAE